MNRVSIPGYSMSKSITSRPSGISPASICASVGMGTDE